jgi:hypothetical protein
MAIYHFSVKNISRSDGRSAVACSAYRSGEKLIDNRQGKEQDYTKKTGVEFKQIYAPKNTNPELLDRNTLWNKVEEVESRKNSQLAREFEIAFPHELDQEQRKKMLNELCQDIVNRHGVIVDAAIHAPHTKSGSDERNYHAHLMLTTRKIDEKGNLGKKTREFNDHGKQEVEFWRKSFAEITNKHLLLAGQTSRVNHRSYAEQNNGLQATIHEGSKVTQLRRQGIDTEISLKNDLIKKQNAEKQRSPEIIKGLDQEIQLAQSQIDKYKIEMSLKTIQRLTEATKEKNPTEPQETHKNANESKIEPSMSHKKEVVSFFYAKKSEVSQKAHELELQNMVKKLNEYTAQSKKDQEQIEKHKTSKPFNPFKVKAWRQELEQLEKNYDKNIRKPYFNLKNQYESSKRNGITYEHRQKAEEYIKVKAPDLYEKAKTFERDIQNAEREARLNTLKERTQDTQKEKNRGLDK